MDGSESRSALVLELAEEFLDRYRGGQRPALKEYTARYPELAGEILEVFPAMAMMEHIALADESLAGGETGMAAATRPARLKQLGDFRIIREVGHGGMGIVYEAEQVSLGRHVALKVLPRQMIDDPRQRRRFERESRAAAKLHHTNIVPVFGVGEHEGTPYYVMQFIVGLGLDEVLEELRRLRTQKGKGAERGFASGGGLRIARRDVSAADVARSLLTGRFTSEPRDTPGRSTLSATLDQPRGSAETSPEPVSSMTSGLVSGSIAAGSSSVVLPGKGSRARRAQGKALTYGHSVAQIGVQVAEALEYAHKQGILHRDVKPSNLLLDTRGTVWVADFGLAKANDQDNLTLTGDLLGTLRYMPPEAFEGKSDARGDIYSLGLTLYELLALRPAFDEKERGRLVKQVTHEAPPRLGTLGAEVPRDLETIVHKAIERDPAHRYATSAELAADLQRFLDDEPIEAQRTTPAERLARWARHNPLVASLGAAVFGLLAMLALSATIAASRIDREKVAAQGAATREAEAARRASRAAAQAGLEAKRASSEAARATRALAAEEASRRSAEAAATREKQARKAVEAANADLRTARDQVRAGLYAAEMNLLQIAWKEEDMDRAHELLARTVPKPGEPDMRGFEWWYWQRRTRAEVGSLRLPEPIGAAGVLSGDGARAACSYRSTAASPANDRVCVYDTSTGRELFERRISGYSTRPLSQGQSVILSLSLDRAGARLTAAWIVDPVAGGRKSPMVELRVWDVSEGREILSVASEISLPPPNDLTRPSLSISISADGTRVALACSQAGSKGGGERCEVKVWDVEDGREVWHTAVEGAAGVLDLALREDGGTIVASLSGRSVPGGSVLNPFMLRVWTVPEGRETLSLSESRAVHGGLAFRPDGARLAVIRREMIGGLTTQSASIQILDTSSGQILRSIEPTGRFRPTNLAYSPDGTRIAAFGGLRSPLIRVWDAETGALRFDLRSLAPEIFHVGFRADGLRLIAAGEATIQHWDLSADRDPSGASASGPEFPSADALALSSDGERLAIVAPAANGRVQEVTVHDAATGRALSRYESALTPRSRYQSVALVFSPDNARLAAWLKSTSGTPGASNVPPSVVVWDAGSGAGRTIAVTDPGAAAAARVEQVVFHPDGSKLAVLRSTPPARPAPGQDLVTAVQIRDAADGRLIGAWEVPSTSLTALAYSPDGRVLAAAGETRSGDERLNRILLLDPADGQVLRIISAGDSAPLVKLVYRPDGAAIAGVSEQSGLESDLTVWDLADGREVFKIKNFAPLFNSTEFRVQLAFSPDSRRLAAARASTLYRTEVRLWDTATGQELISLAREGATPQGLAFDRDGRRLLFPLGWFRTISRAPARLVVLDASPLSPETQAGDRIDALAARFPLHDELRAQLASDPSLPAEVRAAVPRVLEGRTESLARLRALSVELSHQPNRSVAEYERALRHAEAAGRQRGDDPEVRAALGMALVRLDRDPTRALAALARGAAEGEPAALAFLAIEQARLGRRDQAAQSLNRAEKRKLEMGLLSTRALASVLSEVENLLGPMLTAELDRMIAAEPTNGKLLIERAGLHARSRRWAAALADFERVIALMPADHWRYYRAAVIAAYLGDRDHHTRLSRAMVDHFGTSSEPSAIDETLTTAWLLPGAVAPPAALVRNLESALAEGKGDVNFPRWALTHLALADLRSARPSLALERIVLAKKASAGAPNPGLRPLILSIEAACLLEVGREDDARTALRQARRLLEPIFPTDRPGLPLATNWSEVLIAQILYREAEVRLLDADFPSDPFVPLAR